MEAILLDSAGIDEGDGEIEAQSQAAALDRARSVDVVCLVIDAMRPVPEGFLEAVESAAPARIVVARNKIDATAHEPSPLHDQEPLPKPEGASAPSAMARYRAFGPVCPISALRGDGLDELERLLSNAIGASPTTAQSEGVVLTARQNEAIRVAAGTVRRAVALSDGVCEVIDCADVLAFELRDAVEVLGTVTGEVSTEDLLSKIFADFCIGK